MHIFDAFKAKSRSHNTASCDDFDYLVNLLCFYPPWIPLPERRKEVRKKQEGAGKKKARLFGKQLVARSMFI